MTCGSSGSGRSTIGRRPASRSRPRRPRATPARPAACSRGPAARSRRGCPVRMPMISIARCTLRLLICNSSAGHARDAFGDRDDARVELVGREGAVREAHAHRVVAGDRIAGEHELHRVAHADEPRVVLEVGRADDAHDRVAERRVVARRTRGRTRRRARCRPPSRSRAPARSPAWRDPRCAPSPR